MITFPYIDIIEKAPAPLVVIFGLAHVAMGWVIYTYVKDLYPRIVKEMMRKGWPKDGPESTDYKMGWKDAKKVPPDEVDETLEKRRRRSVNILKPVIFFLCWAIIDGIKYLYASLPPP